MARVVMACIVMAYIVLHSYGLYSPYKNSYGLYRPYKIVMASTRGWILDNGCVLVINMFGCDGISVIDVFGYDGILVINMFGCDGILVITCLVMTAY